MSEQAQGVQARHQAWLDQGRFMIQRCAACGQHVYFPREVCPHCGATDRIYELRGQSTRIGVRKCGHCRKPFTVTVNTVMERSHIPLTKWLLATQFMASSKKGMSAHQLHRMLSVTYKTAWFMAHRIREAMTEVKGPTNPMGGEGKTSLVAKWAAELAANDWPGCEAVFAWSFYSQGTREQNAASSDAFLNEALTFFGETEMAASAAGARRVFGTAV